MAAVQEKETDTLESKKAKDTSVKQPARTARDERGGPLISNHAIRIQGIESISWEYDSSAPECFLGDTLPPCPPCR